MHPILQALTAAGVNWLMTALGAAGIFLAPGMSRKALDAMLGFAAGVMLAASYGSLLAPAIGTSADGGGAAWLPAAAGFLAGGGAFWGIDSLLPHLHLGLPSDRVEGVKTSWPRSTLLVLAVSLHNVPEGLAVGVAFGAAPIGLPWASLSSALALSIGIGIQDIPEGLAVALPLQREGLSRWKSFWYGQLSGLVEPITAVIGALAVVLSHAILPYAMGFAAGAMVYVVVEDLIPESQRAGHTDLATVGLLVGFTLMMGLEITLR
jgi:ZIP family zinc transporter